MYLKASHLTCITSVNKANKSQAVEVSTTETLSSMTIKPTPKPSVNSTTTTTFSVQPVIILSLKFPFHVSSNIKVFLSFVKLIYLMIFKKFHHLNFNHNYHNYKNIFTCLLFISQ